MPPLVSLFADNAPQICTDSCYSILNETNNPLGANKCADACDCDGGRTCSAAGFCEGTARPSGITCGEPTSKLLTEPPRPQCCHLIRDALDLLVIVRNWLETCHKQCMFLTMCGPHKSKPSLIGANIGAEGCLYSRNKQKCFFRYFYVKKQE